MPFSELTKDMGIISKLEDEPNDVGGMTAAQLKAKFDEAGKTIQEFLNQTLLPELAAGTAAAQLGAVVEGEKMTVQAALDLLGGAAVQAGNVPMGGSAGDFLRKRSDVLYDVEWAPPFTAYSFAAADWAAGGEGYTLTVPRSVHKRAGNACACALHHLAGGALKSNSWAVAGTQTVYDPDSGVFTLTSADPYDGEAVFYG